MVKSRNINDNITLSHIPMSKLKTTTVGIYIHRPLCEADASKNAMLPMVLKRGSEEFPGMEAISKRLDELYGARLSLNVSKRGEDHVLAFETECIADKYVPDGEPLLKGVVHLLCDIIFRPLTEDGGFCADIFEQEKKNLADAIRAAINDKATYAHEQLCRLLCEGTPYAVSRLGDEEGLEKFDRVSLYEYYKEIITSSVIDIYVAGDADLDTVADEISEFTKDIKFSPASMPHAEILAQSAPKELTERMDVTQGKLAMGFTTGIAPSDDAYWGLVIANSIFGSGAHSKLFNNVREKLSLAYYASSQMHKFKGLIAVNAGVEFANFQKAYDEVLLQLEALKSGDISEQEFNAAKMAVINSLNSYRDDQFYMMSFCLGERIAGTNYDIDYYIGKISAVTAADAAEAAKNIKFAGAYFLSGKEA